MTLQRRLSITLAAVAVLSVTITAVVAIGLLRGYAERSAFAELKRLAQVIAVEVGAGRLLAEREFRPAERILLVSGAQVAVVRPDGRVDGDAAELAETIPNTASLLQGAEIEGTFTLDGSEYAYVGFPVPTRRFAHGVILVRPLGIAGTFEGPVLVRILLAAGAAVVVAIVASALLARRLSDPLHELSEATEKVASGELEHRVTVSSSDEIGKLGASFNEMAAALGEAKRREAEFLQNVSHELRTPLTSIRGYVEALEDGAISGKNRQREALAVIKAETERVERLIEDVTDLARLGTKEFRLERNPIDLNETLSGAVQAHMGQARAAGVKLQFDPDGVLDVETDEVRIRQVVSNLLANALRVTPKDGEVRLAGTSTDGNVLITVSDTGPGISSEQLPHVFERSYLRVGGLGLAIVRQLVSALGGTVEVESQPGRGTTFRIRLPKESA
jgi:two-component system OmpR family sensor kinase